MMPTILRDRRGEILGYIRKQSKQLYAYDRKGTLVGRYDPGTDLTYGLKATPFGRGNLLAVLVATETM